MSEKNCTTCKHLARAREEWDGNNWPPEEAVCDGCGRPREGDLATKCRGGADCWAARAVHLLHFAKSLRARLAQSEAERDCKTEDPRRASHAGGRACARCRIAYLEDQLRMVAPNLKALTDVMRAHGVVDDPGSVGFAADWPEKLAKRLSQGKVVSEQSYAARQLREERDRLALECGVLRMQSQHKPAGDRVVTVGEFAGFLEKVEAKFTAIDSRAAEIEARVARLEAVNGIRSPDAEDPPKSSALARARAAERANADLVGEVARLKGMIESQAASLNLSTSASAIDRSERETAERLLKNLLARVHGDGGHYSDEHGLEKAAADAGEKINALALRLSSAEGFGQRLAESEAALVTLQAGVVTEILGGHSSIAERVDSFAKFHKVSDSGLRAALHNILHGIMQRGAATVRQGPTLLSLYREYYEAARADQGCPHDTDHGMPCDECVAKIEAARARVEKAAGAVEEALKRYCHYHLAQDARQ